MSLVVRKLWVKKEKKQGLVVRYTFAAVIFYPQEGSWNTVKPCLIITAQRDCLN